MQIQLDVSEYIICFAICTLDNVERRKVKTPH
jgi:hypothetical protein